MVIILLPASAGIPERLSAMACDDDDLSAPSTGAGRCTSVLATSALAGRIIGNESDWFLGVKRHGAFSIVREPTNSLRGALAFFDAVQAAPSNPAVSRTRPLHLGIGHRASQRGEKNKKRSVFQVSPRDKTFFVGPTR